MKGIFLTLFISFQAVVYAQKTVFGQVYDERNKPISNVNVSIVSDSLNDIISFTYTNETGYYLLETPKKEEDFSLKFSALGYKSKKTKLSIGRNVSKGINITLAEQLVDLNEVIIYADKPITIKKDTIIFNSKSFTDGTETVAEDLLRKIPGLNISDDGTIKIGNTEVEKVMVDGDDLFERGYKTLTKNLPAAPIEQVELLQRYSNNKLLKGIEESNKVALNLKLSDEAKRQWFGNFDLGYGLTSENRYDSRANLLNFGKKNKYYFFTNFNNVGYDATGDISNLIRSSRVGEPGSIGDDQEVAQQVTLATDVPYFKPSRFRFNNAELVSFNAIFNPTEKLKIKTISFANWDELDFFRNSTENFITSTTNFTNTEDYTLGTDGVTLFGKAEIAYDLAKTATLQSVTKYSRIDDDRKANLLFNTIPTRQRLQTENTRFDQKIAYSNKFKETKALIITGRFISEQAPQNFTVSQNNFASLFLNTQGEDSVLQRSNFSYDYLGLEAHLLDRKKSGNLFELKTGNTYRRDTFQNSFSIRDEEGSLVVPENFQNDLSYSVNDTYVKGEYIYKFSDKLSVGSSLTGHILNNRLEGQASREQDVFYINSGVSTSWKINRKNEIEFLGNITRRNATITEVYDNFALSGFRNAARGTGDFNQLDALKFSLAYTLGNWSDNFFANAFLVHSKSFDFFSTSSNISQEFALSERVLFKDRELWSANLNMDRYLKFITSNLKGIFSFSSVDFQNIVNDSPIRQINSTNYSYGLELRSGFSGIFNYHVGTKWSTNRIESTGLQTDITNNESFLDLTFVVNKKFNFQIQTERYFFGNLETDNTYYFADFESRYTIKENKVNLSISGKNLFNTDFFRELSLNDLGSSTTEYRLLPRYVLLKLTYRF